MLSQYAGEQHALSRVLPDGVMQRSSFAVAVLFWLIYLYPHISRARARWPQQHLSHWLRVLERRQSSGSIRLAKPSRAVHLVKFVLLLRLLLLPAQLGGR